MTTSTNGSATATVRARPRLVPAVARFDPARKSTRTQRLRQQRLTVGWQRTANERR